MAYMTQRGMGSYDHTGDWEWLYYPPPYDFLAPPDSVAIPAPILYTPGGGLSGLGGCGCGGTCGGCGDHHLHGMGLFDTGFDLTGWGIGEWAVAGVGLYTLFKIIGDTKRVTSSVKKSSRSRAAKLRRRESLEKQLAAL
jgi:hypothetical protein